MAAKRQGTETDEQAAVATLTRPSLGLAKPHEVGRDEGFAKSGAHPHRHSETDERELIPTGNGIFAVFSFSTKLVFVETKFQSRPQIIHEKNSRYSR